MLFFKQTVLQRQFGDNFLKRYRLPAQPFDLIRHRLVSSIAGQALLAGLEELLRLAVIPVRVDAFLTTRLGDASLALPFLPLALRLDLRDLSNEALTRQVTDLNAMVSEIRGYYSGNVVG